MRRRPYDLEVTAQVDFAAFDAQWDDAVDELLSAWDDIRAAQIDELIEQVGAMGEDPARLALLNATPRGATVLGDVLARVAEDAATLTVAEAVGQGRQVPTYAVDTAGIRARAGALDVVLANELSNAARRQALARLGVEDLAGEVRTHLETLTDAWLRDQFNGAVTTAAGGGRKAVFDALEADEPDEPVEYYLSALLDANSCSVCVGWDGERFPDLEALLEQAPNGQNKDCLGGARCRCVGVAVYREAAPTP